MKILLVHNYYQGLTSGENVVYEMERALLTGFGHPVVTYERRNDEIEDYGAWQKAALAPGTVWMTQAYRELYRLVQQERPDVVHFHNTFPLISPSAYYAVRAAGSRVVQTLHNYRLLCPNALFLRDERPCEDCLGRFVPWPGVQHACYRDSRGVTATVAAMLAAHRALGTFERVVDRYIALTGFARQKFIEGGLPAEKIAVKPNFLRHDPGVGDGAGGFALYVGRLSHEKGIQVALDAWRRHDLPMPLWVVGDGAYRDAVTAAAEETERIRYLGTRPHDEVLRLMQRAAFLVLPSICYEGFPMTIAEAYACGLPVVASRRGAMASLIQPGETGLHFTADDAASLAEQARWLAGHPDELVRLRRGARRAYAERYTAERNYKELMQIYDTVLQNIPSPS